ncbi:ribosome-binding factor A [Planomonospora parontospora subsp. parontospora]|uniref:Ribosome-binding factor A n=2 Tax=Planomonospora parontospora TaxID=58119 RepID=A0AA37BHE7_9ACTN|nr:30S ribosome-binding factor RbfA [Planomonospora parontospora]GGK72936.1 ribosome-binding factor A [Planomonospora parontospora]GII09336.1 ribosome-binding factor A [Planomonospora parontospora subsp. parontospora]
MDAARARKIADRIQQVVAEMLERRIKDPRLGFVTVTDARITADLGEATVFYTVFGSEAERADSAAALESAKGLIRSEVGRQTGLRHTPTLTFTHDPLPDSARHLDDLFAEARARDEEIARKREKARHAGEADPYRRPRDEADEALEDDEDAEGAADGESGGSADGAPDRAGRPAT